ncbi:MAG: 3-deoxy-D-manno-octulosonate 8-phosphate phosphatase [Sphingomonadales bacterium]|nr:3-deoxy-D-manno-octulosonate 8-phosphate phosphatase [Sphingomonadales bacterium]
MSHPLSFDRITTFVFDVDGVLTDGSVYLMPDFTQARRMNIKDGYALQLAVKKGYRVSVISGGNSDEVKERLRKLGITEVYMAVYNKLELLSTLFIEWDTPATEVLYMGDDLPDLFAMQACGLACCPSDAAPEIKAISHYVANSKGGSGCAREIIEAVLTARGHWGPEENIASR